MNKTIIINIAGIVFHIDEPAYEKLKEYLSAIKAHFNGAEGRDEIIADIESRIAEMFQARLGDLKQVILYSDVEAIITAMGKPEQFGDEEEPKAKETASGAYTETTEFKTRRRLFRDPDDKVLGGVCSGISAYLNIDPIWFRLAFAIAFFVFGSGMLLYIVLWIVLPKAKNTADKLQMRGEKVNIENIEKSIREEIDGLKNKFRGIKEETGTGKIRTFTQRAMDLIVQLATVFLEVFVKVLGIAFIIFSLIVLAVLMGLISGFHTMNDLELHSFLPMIFETSFQEKLAIAALVLVIGVPFFLLLYKGVCLLFNIKNRSRLFNLVFLCLWLIGLVISIFVGSRLSSDFAKRESVRVPVPLMQPAGNTLYINVPDTANENDYGFWFHNGTFRVSEDGKLVNLGSVHLKIMSSPNDQFQLVEIKSARGNASRTAQRRAENIEYSFSQNDSLLTLREHINLPPQEKYRAQQVTMILKVPVGKGVFLHNNSESILDDIQNTEDIWDGDMGGHRWTMTAEGLKCDDCNESFQYNNKHHRHKKTWHKEWNDDEE